MSDTQQRIDDLVKSNDVVRVAVPTCTVTAVRVWVWGSLEI